MTKDNRLVAYIQLVDGVPFIDIVEVSKKGTSYYYDGAGEGQHYAQFYIKGAAFWRDLDQALMGATQGKKTLDDYLPLLINDQYGVNGELPDKFFQAMIDVIGKEKVERLLDQYL